MLAALTPSRRLIGAGRQPGQQALPGRTGVGIGAKKKQTQPTKPKQPASKAAASIGNNGRGGSLSSSSAAVVSIDSSDTTGADTKSPTAATTATKKDGGSRDSTPKIQNRAQKSTAVASAEKAKSLFRISRVPRRLWRRSRWPWKTASSSSKPR